MTLDRIYARLHKEPELLVAVREIVEERDRYKAALEFYAQNPKRESGTEWSDSVEAFGDAVGDDLWSATWEPLVDLGDKAREALKPRDGG